MLGKATQKSKSGSFNHGTAFRQSPLDLERNTRREGRRSNSRRPGTELSGSTPSATAKRETNRSRELQLCGSRAHFRIFYAGGAGLGSVETSPASAAEIL